MSRKLESFRDDLLHALGSDNVILIYHLGSRARGEARPDSDYDTILVLKEIDKGVLQKTRDVLLKHAGFQAYLLSQQDLKDLPHGQRLVFFEGDVLYGDLDLEPPSRDHVLEEIGRSRLHSLEYLRHYLTLPHDQERKAKLVYFQLKDAYFYLRKICYCATGNLVSTRRELLLKLSELPIRHSLAAWCLTTLESYEEDKTKISEDPDQYLLRLERFFRMNRI